MTTIPVPLDDVVLQLRLPGEWAVVPLDDPAIARRSVHALARSAAGPAAGEAILRAPLVRAALAEIDRGLAGAPDAAAAAQAIATGSRLLIARTIVEGIALPLSILVSPLAQQVTPARAPTGGAILDVLELALRARDDGFSAAIRPDLGRATAVRRHRIVPAAPDGTDDAVARLEVEHWLPVPGGRRLVRLLATTPILGMDDVIIGLLDAIVRAARWEGPSIVATPSAAGARED